MSLEELLAELGSTITSDKSFISPMIRQFYLQGYRTVLPANSPDGRLRGLLFCNEEDGSVRYYRFCVHFRKPQLHGTFFVVKNYLDFIAVSELSDELGYIPVLTAGPIGLTTLIWNLEGYKVDRPDYGRYLIVPVEERGGLWKVYDSNPASFREKLLGIMSDAVELDEAIESLRSRG